jgi:phage gp36-like protein
MPYCTKTDIQKEISDEELIGLTDDESAGIINDDRVTEAIADADGLIDSYCGKVVAVPFVTVPPVIKKHSKTIAIYNLYSRRGVAPEIRRKNYEDAIVHLKDISTGKAALPPIEEADVSEEVQAARTEDDRTFTMGKKSTGSPGSLDNY